MNFYDNLWKITILIILIYIIYTIYELKMEIKNSFLYDRLDKSIVYKNCNYNNLEEEEEERELSIEEILEKDIMKNDNDLQSISDISIQSIHSEDLKTKNLKELKSFAKTLNINISKKKKDDIINDILIYCNK